MDSGDARGLPTATDGRGPRAAPLSVRDLRVSFFMDEGVVKAVDGLGFDIAPGQVVGIVGESGCGKSVTMKAVLQIVEPPGRIVSGRILFQPREGDAIDLARLAPRGPRCGRSAAPRSP